MEPDSSSSKRTSHTHGIVEAGAHELPSETGPAESSNSEPVSDPTGETPRRGPAAQADDSPTTETEPGEQGPTEDSAVPLPTRAESEPVNTDATSTSTPDAGRAESTPSANPTTDPALGPAPGNQDANCEIPEEAQPLDVSDPDQIVGTGSAESCTADAFIDAVAKGGVIVFDCGPDPVTITLDRPAQVFNNANDHVVIDGGGLVTISGGGVTRILYMNTCDESLVFTTPHCQDQEFPQLSVQNLTFIDGNSKNEMQFDGGGAIYAAGGRFKVINSRFFNNVCAELGPDVGGGAIRVLQQFESRPVYVVNSTFGGADGLGNSGSNGGALSSIGVNWTVLNSVFSYNHAVGNGGNPAQDNTPGGGSGGAIYNDGGPLELTICGSRLEHNDALAFGSAIFFVSNSHEGTLHVANSIIRENTGGGWNVLPGISMHEDTVQDIDPASIIE